MIRERANAGLARAKAQVMRLGRSSVPTAIEAAIREARTQGKGMLRNAREVGPGSGTVQRVLREPRAK